MTSRSTAVSLALLLAAGPALAQPAAGPVPERPDNQQRARLYDRQKQPQLIRKICEGNALNPQPLPPGPPDRTAAAVLAQGPLVPIPPDPILPKDVNPNPPDPAIAVALNPQPLPPVDAPDPRCVGAGAIRRH